MKEKQFVDYYDALGLEGNASDWEIRNAYRKLAKKYHPDMVIGLSEEAQKECEEKFKLINEAHETLTKKISKLKYDFEYKKQQRKLRFTNVYQEDDVVEEVENTEKETEDLSAVWPRSKSRTSSEQEVTEIVKASAGEFTDLDFDYLNSLTARRYEPRPKKKTDFSVKVKNGVVHAKSTFVALMKENQMFKKGKYSKGYSLKEKVIAGTLAVVITGSVAAAIFSNDEDEVVASVVASESYDDELMVTTAPTELIEETTEATEAKDNSITLYRVHTVVTGDTLAIYSIESNTTQEEIKRVNNTKSDTVQLGKDYIIPYIVEPEDLKFYTQVAQYNPIMSIEEFAKEYETNIGTLETLNPEAIDYNGSQYVISTDTLVVPNFITKEDYQVLKAAEAIQQKTYTKNN